MWNIIYYLLGNIGDTHTMNFRETQFNKEKYRSFSLQLEKIIVVKVTSKCYDHQRERQMSTNEGHLGEVSTKTLAILFQNF